MIAQNAPTDPAKSASSIADLPTTVALPDDMHIAMSPGRIRCSFDSLDSGTHIRLVSSANLSPMLPALRIGISPGRAIAEASPPSKETPRINVATLPRRLDVPCGLARDLSLSLFLEGFGEECATQDIDRPQGVQDRRPRVSGQIELPI